MDGMLGHIKDAGYLLNSMIFVHQKLHMLANVLIFTILSAGAIIDNRRIQYLATSGQINDIPADPALEMRREDIRDHIHGARAFLAFIHWSPA